MTTNSPFVHTEQENNRQELDEDEESDIYEFEGEEEVQGGAYEPNEEDEEEDEKIPQVNKAGLTALLLGEGGQDAGEDEDEDEDEEGEEYDEDDDDDEYYEESFQDDTPQRPGVNVVSKGTKRGADELSDDDDASSSAEDEDENGVEEKNAKKIKV